MILLVKIPSYSIDHTSVSQLMHMVYEKVCIFNRYGSFISICLRGLFMFELAIHKLIPMSLDC